MGNYCFPKKQQQQPAANDPVPDPDPVPVSFPIPGKGAFGEFRWIWGGSVKLQLKQDELLLAISKVIHLPAANAVGFEDDTFTAYDGCLVTNKAAVKKIYDEIYALPTFFEGRDAAIELLRKIM